MSIIVNLLYDSPLYLSIFEQKVQENDEENGHVKQGHAKKFEVHFKAEILPFF